MLISLRHTDAVYRLDRATGAIEWKLGGTPTDESLAVLNDPLAADPLGAQHDIRYLGDGEISIHDNGTDLGRAPRAVRYRVEGSSATLLDAADRSSGARLALLRLGALLERLLADLLGRSTAGHRVRA